MLKAQSTITNNESNFFIYFVLIFAYKDTKKSLFCKEKREKSVSEGVIDGLDCP